jgi:hypothetical protein
MIEPSKAERIARRLTPSDWVYAVDQYELGHCHIGQLAALFGVSRQAIWKGLKKRAAIKARRIDEHRMELLSKLDQSEAERLKREADRAEASALMGKAMYRIVLELAKADRLGEIDTRLQECAAMLGVRLPRPRKSAA